MSDPLTLGSSSIYFNEISYDLEPIELSLGDIQEAPVAQIRAGNIFGVGGLYPEDEISVALQPGYFMPMPHGYEDQWISSVGYIDGKLHVQMTDLWNKQFGSSGAQLNLVHSDGSILEYDYQTTLQREEAHNPVTMDDYDMVKICLERI